jgi:hypothetical protein
MRTASCHESLRMMAATKSGGRVEAMDAIRNESDDVLSHSMDVTGRPVRPAFQPDTEPANNSNRCRSEGAPRYPPEYRSNGDIRQCSIPRELTEWPCESGRHDGADRQQLTQRFELILPMPCQLAEQRISV